MSADIRAVPIDALQADLIEEIGLELMRKGDERASRVLAIFLAWKVSRRAEVSDIPVFRCDIDESAGMADVVELHGWSKKAPCA